MAPPNGSAKGRKAAAPKHQPKPVVPALPLKRNSAPVTAVAKSKTVKAPGSQVNTTTPETAPKKQHVNGAAEETVIENATASSASGSHRRADSTACESSYNGSPRANGRLPTELPSKIVPKPQAVANSAPSTNESDLTPNGEGHIEHINLYESNIGSTKPKASLDNSTGSDIAALQDQSRERSAARNAVEAAKKRPSSTVSPPRYQMPPPFQPAGRPYGAMNGGDLSHGPPVPFPNGPISVHHSHPSNGSIHFGTFQDSQSPSPVPPHTGGMVPPPGIATADARPAYMGMGPSVFPHPMPLYGDIMQPGNFESYGRPGIAYGPMETYATYVNGNFGPSTPHSFRDSQSSGPPEDAGIYHQYLPNGHRNGATGHGEPDGNVRNPQGRMFAHPDYARKLHRGSLAHPGAAPEDDGDGFLGYMRHQFSNTELADCTLELRYTDDRAAPVRIPGHRIFFARSSRLYEAIKSSSAYQTSSDQGMQNVVLLRTGSKWIRSDSFYMAVQRLYGHDLLTMPPRYRTESDDITDAGTSDEQLDFALSYAAAGHLLQWTSVVRRGCEMAAQLLSWHSMEKILEFALESSNDNGSHMFYKYKEGSGVLVEAVVAFIINNLSPTFNLDTGAEHSGLYGRFPECAPPPAASEKQAPVIARGSSVHLGKGRRSQQLTGIQFGDLSLADDAGVSDSVTPKAAQQAQPVPHAVLSRVLVNLPFSLLKMILESAGSGNVNGWATAESRYRIIRAAVEERESRRLCTREALLHERIQSSEAVRSGLCSPMPQDIAPWNVLGWQEEILPYGNTDRPSLERTWVPFVKPRGNTEAAYP